MLGSLFAEESMADKIKLLQKELPQNPYGHPFTLNIAVQREDDYRDPDSGCCHTRLDVTLPVSSWLTLKYGTFHDRWMVNDSYESWLDSKQIISKGIEIHLPIYKLWSN